MINSVAPHVWPYAPLGDHFVITSSKRVFQKDWRSRGVPFYRARELAVLGRKGWVNNELFIDREMYERFQRSYGAPSAGDFLITGVGTLGKTYVVKDGDEFYFKDGNIIWLKRSSSVESNFLNQLYKTPFIIDQIFGNSAGSTVGTYTITNAKKTIIPLPHPVEQRAIARALDDTDKLIESLENLITKKMAIKKGIEQQLLTGRIRLPGFTKQWQNVVLGDVAQFSKGNGLPKSALSPSGSKACIHYGELFTSYGPEIFDITSRTTSSAQSVYSEDLDVLMPTSDVTPRGLAKASAIHSRGVILGGDILIIRAEKSLAYGPFIAHTIRLDENQVLKLVRGSTVYHLYASDMGKFEMFLPDVIEQKAIAKVISDTSQEIETLQVRLSKTIGIKTGMMQQLLTGRIRINEGAK